MLIEFTLLKIRYYYYNYYNYYANLMLVCRPRRWSKIKSALRDCWGLTYTSRPTA